MRRLTRWYGAHPLHLLALMGSFAVAGYAAVRLVAERPVGVALWFLGAAVGHDLVLLPLYAIAQGTVVAAWRRRWPRLPIVPWVNYVRVPVALSALLLLVWSPLIFRLSNNYEGTTGLSSSGYLGRWLLVSGALFFASAVALAVRLRGVRRSNRRPAPG